MKTVDLKDEYRTETNEDVYSEDTHYGGSGSFSDEYVKWLESKLKNNEALDLVSNRDVFSDLRQLGLSSGQCSIVGAYIKSL